MARERGASTSLDSNSTSLDSNDDPSGGRLLAPGLPPSLAEAVALARLVELSG